MLIKNFNSKKLIEIILIKLLEKNKFSNYFLNKIKTIFSITENHPNYTDRNVTLIRENYKFEDLNDQKVKNNILKFPQNYIIKHLEEIVSIGYNLPSYLKYADIAIYKNFFKTNILVETGTLYGDCCDFFKDSFDKIYTIDIDDWCYNNAKIRFEKYPNIVPVLGDSGKKILDILEKINEQAIFFLDGHYSFIPNHFGYKSMKSNYSETPIVKELESIANHKIKNHIILIDDAGCFDNSDHKDYPQIEELKKLCEKLFPNHVFATKYGSIRLSPEEVNLF